MTISFEKALGIHESALHFRSARASVLANNLANIDTPNFKAQDLDFKQALSQSMRGSSGFQMATHMTTTQSQHIDMSSFGGDEGELLYRIPQQPSIDGNTVEDQIEHAEYMKNTLAFQASFQFLNSKFIGLRTAIRGD